MYTTEKFDEKKTQVMKYILYKKRTESEVRTKFNRSIEENMLEDIIEYVKTAGYINDKEYIKKTVKEYMNLKTMSIREIKSKLHSKGLYVEDIEDYLYENKEELEEFEMHSAEKLVNKKQGMDKEKLKMYLINKGYDLDTVNKLIESNEE